MSRRLGDVEKPSAKKAAANARNARSRWLDPLEYAKLDEAKAELRAGVVKATPRLVGMLTDPLTPPGLFIELWKLLANKVGLSDRIEQSITMPAIPQLVVVVGEDEATQ